MKWNLWREGRRTVVIHSRRLSSKTKSREVSLWHSLRILLFEILIFECLNVHRIAGCAIKTACLNCDGPEARRALQLPTSGNKEALHQRLAGQAIHDDDDGGGDDEDAADDDDQEDSGHVEEEDEGGDDVEWTLPSRQTL
jgi:hypothetical protein